MQLLLQNVFNHSHKKREMRAVLIRSLCYLEICQAAQNTGDYFKKMDFSKANQLFAGDFHAALDEIKADMLQFTKMQLEMDCLTSRILLQKASSYKCQFCTKVCASSRLAFQL